MPRSPYLSFANLTCRFGDQFVLLDLAKEVVLPAFFDPSHSRKHGLASYFFREVGAALINVENVDEPQLVVYGRFIKDTILIRNQTFSEERGLVQDDATLPSAPSSFFALNLNDHKLMFLPETPFAPTLQQFGHALQSFTRKELQSYLRAIYEAAKLTDEPRTFAQLHSEFPAPDVKVTPLAGVDDVDAFVESFAKITRLEFRLLSTNAEFSQGNNFSIIRSMKDEVAATQTSLVHENQAGLKKSAVAEEVKEAAGGGNQKVKFTGIAEDGTKFTGGNEDLKLQIAFPNPPESLLRRASEAVRSYFLQVGQGRLRPDISRTSEEKLAIAREALNDRIERN